METGASDEAIKVPKGEVLWIGDINILPIEGIIEHFPRLSFLTVRARKIVPRKPRTPEALAKEARKAFICTCINMQINGYGETPEKAEMNMLERTYDILLCYLGMSHEGWDIIRELFKSREESSGLWDAYNEAQIRMMISALSGSGHSDLSFRIYELRPQTLNGRVLYFNTASQMESFIACY